MDIDTSLGVIPTATAIVHESACLGTTIVGILGIEDIVDLAQKADVRALAIGYW